MELWIRSQDKYTLLKYNNKITIIDGTGMKEALNKSFFSALADMEQMQPLKDGWCLSVDDLILGTYATKERVLEVLDEIQTYIEKQGTSEILSQNGISNVRKYYSRVYEMPED